MKVSTRGRYGLQLLIDLTRHKTNAYIPLGTVSERQGVSVRYLEYVAIILKKHGILVSSKGVSGGYKLKKEPKDIKIGDVLRILEGDMYVIDPLKPGETENEYRSAVRKFVFEKINTDLACLIDGITLEQLTQV